MCLSSCTTLGCSPRKRYTSEKDIKAIHKIVLFFQTATLKSKACRIVIAVERSDVQRSLSHSFQTIAQADHDDSLDDLHLHSVLMDLDCNNESIRRLHGDCRLSPTRNRGDVHDNPLLPLQLR